MKKKKHGNRAKIDPNKNTVPMNLTNLAANQGQNAVQSDQNIALAKKEVDENHK